VSAKPQRVNFRVLEDADVVLELADGTRLRVRPIIHQVLKMPQADEVTGDQLYQIQSYALHIHLEPKKEYLS
jgi:hypothetical protein